MLKSLPNPNNLFIDQPSSDSTPQAPLSFSNMFGLRIPVPTPLGQPFMTRPGHLQPAPTSLNISPLIGPTSQGSLANTFTQQSNDYRAENFNFNQIGARNEKEEAYKVSLLEKKRKRKNKHLSYFS